MSLYENIVERKLGATNGCFDVMSKHYAEMKRVILALTVKLATWPHTNHNGRYYPVCNQLSNQQSLWRLSILCMHHIGLIHLVTVTG